MTFLAPQFLWAFLAVPLVIALHFIRTRRRKETVSALFLWRQAQEMAQKKRRFSATWLLFLQLLFVSLAALALARPSFVAEAAPDRVFIFDASASMAAYDSDGLRLDKAREAADEVLRASGRVALIRAGEVATVLEGLSEDHGRIRGALLNLQAVEPQVNLQRALELAESIAPGAPVHVFSDSPLPAGAQAQLHPVGGDALNIGITAFELRGAEAFVTVMSNDPRPQQVGLRLEREGEVVVETTVRVSATSPGDALLNTGGQPGFYRASLFVPDWDALELDNVAYAGSRALRVLQVGASAAVERALTALPGVADVRVVGSVPTTVAAYDVVVLVGAVPVTLPPGRYLIFAPQQQEPSYQNLIDWDRGHPLLRFVDLSGVVVAETSAEPLPEANWRTLAQTDTLSPAIRLLQDGELEAVFFGFHPSQTDLINRAAFPILLYNIFGEFRGENRLPLGSLLPPAERVTRNGTPVTLSRALEPGIYSLDGNLYAASLLSAEQTRLPGPVEAVTVTQPLTAEETTARQLEGALVLIAIALLLLLGEWLLWSRGATAWASRG